MARQTTKCFMGIPENCKVIYKGDTISTSIRKRSSYPSKVGLTSYRMENYDKSKNDEVIRLQLNLVDEVQATAEQRLARYQNLMAKHYNSKVRHRDF